MKHGSQEVHMHLEGQIRHYADQVGTAQVIYEYGTSRHQW